MAPHSSTLAWRIPGTGEPGASAGIQKLFCGIYLTFKCSFDEFVGEKVFSPSYSSAILAPPLFCLYYSLDIGCGQATKTEPQSSFLQNVRGKKIN